ncbi:MAG: hypothetical protein ACLU1W_06945, partial [Collinsella sp.]
VKVCPEHALKLVEHDASNLIVVDPEAEERPPRRRRLTKRLRRSRLRQRPSLTRCSTKWRSSRTS